MLARYQAEPRGHVAPVLEIPTVSHGRNNRRRDLWADALNPCHSLHKAARSKRLVNAPIEYGDWAIDLPHEIEKLRDRCPGTARQAIAGALQCQGTIRRV